VGIDQGIVQTPRVLHKPRGKPQKQIKEVISQHSFATSQYYGAIPQACGIVSQYSFVIPQYCGRLPNITASFPNILLALPNITEPFPKVAESFPNIPLSLPKIVALSTILRRHFPILGNHDSMLGNRFLRTKSQLVIQKNRCPAWEGSFQALGISGPKPSGRGRKLKMSRYKTDPQPKIGQNVTAT
jgi:hypothetical protein